MCNISMDMKDETVVCERYQSILINFKATVILNIARYTHAIFMLINIHIGIVKMC